MKKIVSLFPAIFLALSVASCSDGRHSSGSPYLSSESETSSFLPSDSESPKDERYAVYQLAKAEGYQGTYEEWLASIRGADGASFLNGQGTPTNIGKDGDIYLDLSSWDVYVKSAGAWSKVGNIMGPQGPKGDQGEQGPKGDQGPQGESGKDGTSLLTGRGSPAADLGFDGDSYIDLDSWNYYAKASGQWSLEGNLKESTGEQGPRGESAYEAYCKAHPEYVGTEEQWLDDLVNGRLGAGETTYYVVTFDLGYGGRSFIQIVGDGRKARRPDNPERPGYAFLDWVDKNGNSWAFDDYAITGDITLCAVWSEPLQYTVTFLNDDGSFLGIQTGRYGEEIRFNGANPIAQNPKGNFAYEFMGWDKGPVITGDMTLTAQYRSCDQDLQIENGQVRKYTGNASSVSIPATWGGFPITSIGDYAFYGCSSLASVVIPDSVTSIGRSAFSGCSSLASISIPSSVASIGDYAFYGCSSLASISIPTSVTTIGGSAFWGCSSLASISIPDGVASIGERAFYDCPSLTSLSVDPANPVYDSRGGCNAIIETATGKLLVGCSSTVIPDGVTSIGEYTFNSSPESIEIPSSVTSISSYAFVGMSLFASPASISVDPANPVYDSRGGCNAIIETATGKLLVGCSSTVIPDGVTSIGEAAFCFSSSPTSIEIPSSVVSIANPAFACPSTTSISVDPANPVYDSRGGCNAIIETATGKLLVGCSSTVIPDGVTSLAGFAFFCSSLTSIEIPSSVTSIGFRAFSYCSTLASVVIPSSVVSIGSNVCEECDPNLVIYCEAQKQPAGWNSYWNGYHYQVVWGYVGD